MLVKLSDVASATKGKQINGNDLLDKGLYGFLNGGINYSGRWNDYNTEENSITISEGGNSCGYVKFNSEKIWCGAHCYSLQNIIGNKKYLFYNLKYNESKIMNLRTGACMPNLKKNDLLSFQFNYDYNEKNQKKVADVFETIDCLLANRKEQILILEKLKFSRYSDIYNSSHNFDEIGNHCTIKARIGWQGLTKKEYLDNGKYFLITGTDFEDKKINFDNCHYVTKERYEQDVNIQIHVNDVLITKDGTIGKVAYINEEPSKPTTLNSGVFLVRANKTIDPVFLVYTLLSSQFKNYIENTKTGATISHLNQGIFVKYKMPIPDSSIQKEFVDFVYKVDIYISSLQNDIIYLEKLKLSKYKEYFS